LTFKQKTTALSFDLKHKKSEPYYGSLFFEPGQRKEGLLSVVLWLGDVPFYQIIFWINTAADGTPAMWIGAMQGPNMAHAQDVVKQATKACHSYRTKNLVLYVAQAAARALGLRHIYAVTNEGYYANNHIRMDRKLKTDFSEFWREAGGIETKDMRFMELPLTEKRKTMEEVPTRKRAVYRRRFASRIAAVGTACKNERCGKKQSARCNRYFF